MKCPHCHNNTICIGEPCPECGARILESKIKRIRIESEFQRRMREYHEKMHKDIRGD